MIQKDKVYFISKLSMFSKIFVFFLFATKWTSNKTGVRVGLLALACWARKCRLYWLRLANVILVRSKKLFTGTFFFHGKKNTAFKPTYFVSFSHITEDPITDWRNRWFRDRYSKAKEVKSSFSILWPKLYHTYQGSRSLLGGFLTARSFFHYGPP